MAFIPKTNVVNGNTIQASDITNIIDSLNGTGLYDISATGSLLGTASFATTASYVRNAVSASFATTASYALNVPPPSGPDAAIQFKSGSMFSGSEDFKFNYTLSSLSQGANAQTAGGYSHAEGFQTTTSGSYSHAEGAETLTLADYSHAEGWKTIAGYMGYIISGSISNGVITLRSDYGNITSSFNSGNTIILDSYLGTAISGFTTPEIFTLSVSSSGFEGGKTFISASNTSFSSVNDRIYIGKLGTPQPPLADQKIGTYSHTAGSGSVSIGANSYAGGNQTVTLGYNQTVVGEYNAYDSSSLFVVGRSTPGDGGQPLRATAFSVSRSGSIVVGGALINVAGPSHTGVDGEMIPVFDGSTAYLYISLRGGWFRVELVPYP